MGSPPNSRNRRGILANAPASDGTAYKEYVLTPKGEKLYLVVVALWQWGEEFCFAPGELTYDMVDKDTRRPFQPLELKARNGRVLGARDMRARLRPTSKVGREAKANR